MNFRSLLYSLVCVAPVATHAQVLVSETFEYPPDSALQSADGGMGWSTPWMADLALSAPVSDEPAVAAESLDSPAFRSRGLEPSGNRFLVPDSVNGAQLFRGLENKISWGKEGVHYLSFLVYWTGNHSTASARLQLAFGEQGSGGVFTGSTFVALQSAESDDVMRLVVRNQGETAFGQQPLRAGKVYFVVARLKTAAADLPDEVSAVVYEPADEVPAQEPDEWMATAAKPRTGQTVLIDLGLHVYRNKREVSFDELRMGNTWESVTSR